MTTLLHNAMLDDKAVDIEIADGLVLDVRPSSAVAAADMETIDCTGLAAFAGLKNMHSHAPMTLLRGLGDDQPLDRWLNDYIWPAEQRLTDELVYQGTLAACHEMLASGTTAFNDMYFHLPAMARAVADSGIRARLGLNIFGDGDELLPLERGEWMPEQGELIGYSIAPHSVYTVSQRGLRRAAEACARWHMPMHIHMNETEKEVVDCLREHGCRPWEWLEKIGVLDLVGGHIIAAHCLHISDNEIRLMARYGAVAVHCPCSNLKLGSGYRFAMSELRAAGVEVAIGTDGSASSNNLDMIEAMKMAALLQKGWRSDPTAAPASQILDMGTRGARIERGAVADLFLVRLNQMEHHRLSSDVSHLSTLIYATHGERVEMTMVGGKIVYKKQ